MPTNVPTNVPTIVPTIAPNVVSPTIEPTSEPTANVVDQGGNDETSDDNVNVSEPKKDVSLFMETMMNDLVLIVIMASCILCICVVCFIAFCCLRKSRRTKRAKTNEAIKKLSTQITEMNTADVANKNKTASVSVYHDYGFGTMAHTHVDGENEALEEYNEEPEYQVEPYQYANNQNIAAVAAKTYGNPPQSQQSGVNNNGYEEEEEEEDNETVHVLSYESANVKNLDPGYDQVLSGPSLRQLGNETNVIESSEDTDDSSYATGTSSD